MPTLALPGENFTLASAGGLDAVPLRTPGWRALDLTPLYGIGPRIGENRPIPGVAGRLAVDHEIDELRVALPMRFTGAKDREGNTHTDPFDGVLANLLYFRKHVVDYLPTRSGTLTRRDVGTVTGTVVVDGWEYNVDPRSGGDVILAVLRLTVPAGSLVTP